MKIYTKTGDQGQTSLLGGERLSKDELRIECYGTVDELNSHLGKLSTLTDHRAELLHGIQNRLFDIGSVLACKDPKAWNLQGVNADDISALETDMDRMNEELPALTNFVIPGGDEAAAEAHIARCVCRRAERRIVSLSAEEEVAGEIVQYLNRLSDWCFVFSRYIMLQANVTERIWKSR